MLSILQARASSLNALSNLLCIEFYSWQSLLLMRCSERRVCQVEITSRRSSNLRSMCRHNLRRDCLPYCGSHNDPLSRYFSSYWCMLCFKSSMYCIPSYREGEKCAHPPLVCPNRLLAAYVPSVQNPPYLVSSSEKMKVNLEACCTPEAREDLCILVLLTPLILATKPRSEELQFLEPVIPRLLDKFGLWIYGGK